jgi:hypothetical protein
MKFQAKNHFKDRSYDAFFSEKLTVIPEFLLVFLLPPIPTPSLMIPTMLQIHLTVFKITVNVPTKGDSYVYSSSRSPGQQSNTAVIMLN